MLRSSFGIEGAAGHRAARRVVVGLRISIDSARIAVKETMTSAKVWTLAQMGDEMRWRRTDTFLGLRASNIVGVDQSLGQLHHNLLYQRVDLALRPID